MPPSEPIDLTVEPRDLLPKVVTDEWLPKEEKSIFFELVLHQATVQHFDYVDLLKIPPPALPDISKAYQDAIKKSKPSILSVTLQLYQRDPITLPTWIFLYWVEIQRAVGIWQQWKIALRWVKEQSALPQASDLHHRLLLGLFHFSWSHGAAYTKDITPLLLNSSVESFLNSFHIDHGVGKIRADYWAQVGPDHAGRHVFATVDHFNAIINFYGPSPVKKDGYQWDILMVVENQVVTGEVDVFCGVMHLPLHWVSVVIDFQQLKILYGDFLTGQMPKRQHQACECTLVASLLSTPLPTLNIPLLSPDPIILVCHQMEITLDIISKMTTIDGDSEIPDDLSFLSPPTFVQPLPGFSPTPLVSSGVTSDSDLPPLPTPSKPPQPVNQAGLFNFFSAKPAEEVHAGWSEKKRKNRDRNEERGVTAICQEEEWKNEKLQVSRDNNRLSQQKRQKRMQHEEIKAGIRAKDGKGVEGRQIIMLKHVIIELEREVQIPSQSEVASASCPKQAILTEVKRQESTKAGKTYKPTKQDEAPHKTTNWKSEIFWPMIETAAGQQIGKPNLTQLVSHLQQFDEGFEHLSHQWVRLSGQVDIKQISMYFTSVHLDLSLTHGIMPAIIAAKAPDTFKVTVSWVVHGNYIWDHFKFQESFVKKFS
ncbi:hypothetical protein BJ322DRAFT_1017812 [Thelephora terrestris]|uniref:Uncharacterized protein n=1 Tax=Thelephora terrestris TaxID=56493 RepID=A0A9P6HRP1_9AGAM|nr:hypothetical protein BJ322DRAFT_1017812 [Thelephora terrestris]